MIGIGIDAVDVARMRAIVARRPGFVTRVFTDAEQAYAESAKDSAERYAARFAAKEAVLKALGVGLWKAKLSEIEVVRDAESGAPALRLTGAAADLATERGVGRWLVSLTHTDTIAQAVAVALAD
ncbi:MAG: holo-ACP synthase [Actinomycetota bacterium]|nr:holo-ACP synthase [Actinomycetota bacterium]